MLMEQWINDSFNLAIIDSDKDLTPIWRLDIN